MFICVHLWLIRSMPGAFVPWYLRVKAPARLLGRCGMLPIALGSDATYNYSWALIRLPCW